MPMGLAFVTIVVKAATVEVRAVFSLEPGMVMIVVSAVMIVSVPGRIGVIGVAGIGSFVDAYTYVDLGAGGINSHRAGNDEAQNK